MTKELSILSEDSFIPSAEELREITVQGSKRKVAEATEHEELPKDLLEHYINCMEKDILEFAANGFYKVDWNYNSIDPAPSRFQLDQIASEFKLRHADLMVIVAPNTITVSWEINR